jgi:hypothetical protein
MVLKRDLRLGFKNHLHVGHRFIYTGMKAALQLDVLVF